MVHDRLLSGATPPLRHDIGPPLFESRHVPVRKGNDTQGLSPGSEQHGCHHGQLRQVRRLILGSECVSELNNTTRSQLAEQYGNDVASEILARSRSNLHLDVLPYENRH